MKKEEGSDLVKLEKELDKKTKLVVMLPPPVQTKA